LPRQNSVNSRKKMKYLLLAIILFLSISNLGAQEYIALSGATLINPATNEIIPNSVILIKDGKIVSAGKEIKGKLPELTRVINCASKFIIPGLIDGHIHFFQSGGLYTRPDGLDLRHRVPYDLELQNIKDNLDDTFRRYMRCGVTTVIDAGGPMWNFDVRDKAKNADIAPNVYVAGPLIASYTPDALKSDDQAIIKVSNKEEALALVQKQVNAGADLIKIWYIADKELGMDAEEFYPIVESIAEEAHKNNLKVFVHATELETAKKAIRAGCDVLAHNVRDKIVDEEFLELAKEYDVIVIPTLWVFESYASVYTKKLDLLTSEHVLGNPFAIASLTDMHELEYSELGERQRKLLVENKGIQTNPILLENLKKISDYGIKIAMGTDAGNVGVLHGPSVFHEMLWMQKSGMSKMDILKSATLGGAQLLDKQHEIGSLEAGKFADLVVLNSNPLDTLENLSDIYLVMKNGKDYFPKQIIEPTTVDIAQLQLNGYNTGDIDAFMAAYADDVEVYMHPDSLLYIGTDKMREIYTKFFASAPSLHCKLVSRMSIGNKVLDREIVTGVPVRGTIEAIAIYEIRDGLIRKIWFMK
jgi:imidazolonepropionase-like amidohydrolase